MEWLGWAPLAQPSRTERLSAESPLPGQHRRVSEQRSPSAAHAAAQSSACAVTAENTMHANPFFPALFLKVPQCRGGTSGGGDCLASCNPREPASRASPGGCSLYLTRYKDECFTYSCEKWEQSEAYQVHTSSLPFAPSFFRFPRSADRNTTWCFISELFPAAACKNCLCF